MYKIKSRKWVYKHLVCEFSHWDVCLTGLIKYKDTYYFCSIIDIDSCADKYKIYPINWTKECEEYLADYYKAYQHWFYTKGRRGIYDGRDLTWFNKKWKKRNPIENHTKKKDE